MTRGEDRYRSLCDAIRREPLPLAVVDLDALEANVDWFAARARAAGKTIRVATKSLRSPELIRRVADRGGEAFRGVMAYSAREAAFLASSGFGDAVVAYPSAQPVDARAAVEANRAGAAIALVADDEQHLSIAADAARAAGVRQPIVIDVDVSYRPIGAKLHLGARRSPLHSPIDVGDVADRVALRPELRLAGVLAYEAHLAGLVDSTPGAAIENATHRAFKRIAERAVRDQRRAIREELARRGHSIDLFNGGGTGSIDTSLADPSLTEVAVGSGFLDSHLFDRYAGLALAPAAFFALAVTRIPGPGFATCQSGGFVASGAVGPDRLPLPHLPEGLRLTPTEGAGEVQTPLLLPRDLELHIGDPVFFRHAKAGELAEHFETYLLVRSGRIEGRAPTYRGLGRCFH